MKSQNLKKVQFNYLTVVFFFFLNFTFVVLLLFELTTAHVGFLHSPDVGATQVT